MTPCRASPTVWTRRSRRSGRVPHTSYELCNIRLSGLLSGVWDNFHDQLLWAAVIYISPRSHRRRQSFFCLSARRSWATLGKRSAGCSEEESGGQKRTVAKVKRGA